MDRVCIAVVDASRARFFTLDREIDGAVVREELVEHTDLVNPVHRSRPGSDTRSGSSRTGDLPDRFDGRRDHPASQVETRFARTAMAALRELIDEHPTQRAIICAGPSMLGKLRASTPGLLPEGVKLDELARDLVRLPVTELRAKLSSYGVLPPRPPSTTFMAR